MSVDHVGINFTWEKLKEFKQAYEKAKLAGIKEFTFEGNEFVLEYAYYLIQYLEMKFQGKEFF